MDEADNERLGWSGFVEACHKRANRLEDCPTNDNNTARNAGRPNRATELKKLEKEGSAESESESENN
ncbi:hypothetical protein TSTA_065800 [Talaromyces stipitatus ATCC 10500]|uniref:Uncharacterized protein n=1 Tax=Talaromyces stipitatus (strain ATCC 10500 / CBS 375.48 / QM 6759 / NRRL 1006) TaxID=441959 RepID=B8LV77_TALSN|nr:uncharacterized protein TSTA_065800 [Talaromyces stipitatus ATCC 10500]EED23127.1 hypothetical protein TSTA_065800 [Talaromyces stipitatus ATCC 10500]